MISKKDKEKIRAISKKYKVKKVLLFGSSLNPDNEPNDIDLALEGVDDKIFYAYCAELYFSLSKPVDFVDLKSQSKFNDLVRSEGVVIYG